MELRTFPASNSTEVPEKSESAKPESTKHKSTKPKIVKPESTDEDKKPEHTSGITTRSLIIGIVVLAIWTAITVFAENSGISEAFNVPTGMPMLFSFFVIALANPLMGREISTLANSSS